jgi:hypothetical protein
MFVSCVSFLPCQNSLSYKLISVAVFIPRDRLSAFIMDVYHNFGALHTQHCKLLDCLHAIQRDEHPIINSVTAAIFDTALNWRDEYMEYITNYPIAEYRVVDEMANNPTFKEFVEVCSCTINSVHDVCILNSPLAMHAASRRKPPRHEELREPADPTSRTI